MGTADGKASLVVTVSKEISKKLHAGKLVGELAQLLYELGKAYVLKANEAMSGRLGRPTMVSLKKAVDIRSTSAQGRKLAREVEELETAGGQRETGSLFGRSRRLFSSSSRAGAGLLTNGRRLLEAALTVEPDLDPARLYLGLHHMLSGRFDRARLEFRRVYREAADPIHRTMAINMLGNVHATTYDFTRAIECYEEVVAAEPAGHEPLFTALINLAVNCVKAGHVAKGVHHFHELVDRFPAQVDETRTLLTKKQDFMNLLQRQVSLQRDLSRQIPALFAA